ncbi:MAG: penicillin-binding protein 1B [Steroidobacteraceae bacterium]
MKKRWWLPLIAGTLGVPAVVYLVRLDARVTRQFEAHRWSVPAQVYAAPLELRTGSALSADDLLPTLERLRYRRTETLAHPGTYRWAGDRLEVWLRPAQFADGRRPADRVSITLQNGAIRSIADEHGAVSSVRLEPLRIGSLYPATGEDRLILTPEEVPPLLPAALKAVEDRRFDKHHGVDWSAIGRALWIDVRAGQAEQGASTLTEQLVKSYFPSRRRTLGRKLPEALMALLLEAHYRKADILNAYLNQIDLGQDGDRAIHGFGLASEFYFGEPVGELDLAQLATLVAVVRGPTLYDPRRNPLQAIERRNLVLRIMAAQRLVSDASAHQAMLEPLGVRPRPGGRYYPAYLDLVRRDLGSEYRSRDLTGEGLQIFTSLDPRVQEEAERAVERTIPRIAAKHARRDAPLQAAVVVTAPQTGDVLAIVGSSEVGSDGFDRALDAHRQIGSLVKPFIYLAALESGAYEPATIVYDTPIRVRIPHHGFWQPANFTHRVYGPVPLVRALADSLNLATVGLGLQLGLPTVAQSIERFGLDRPLPQYPSLLLGTIDLTPIEVAQLYGGLANGGQRVRLRAVRAVLTREGTVVKTYASDPVSVARRDAVYAVDRMLEAVMERGTGRSARDVLPAGLVVAGKSGTSSDLRDSWFAGFSGSHLIVAWVGYDDDRPTGLTGSAGALPIWADLMGQLSTTSWKPPMPATLRDVAIDYATGYAAAPGCSDDALSVPIPVGIAIPLKPGCVVAAAAAPPNGAQATQAGRSAQAIQVTPRAQSTRSAQRTPSTSSAPIQQATARHGFHLFERMGKWLHANASAAR